jgi:hypothetical protein
MPKNHAVKTKALAANLNHHILNKPLCGCGAVLRLGYMSA